MIEPLLQRSAPAKINLTLEIIARRADGYHELNTIFHRLHAPADILTVYKAEAFSLTCDDRTLDVGEGNLVVKAFRAYQHAVPELTQLLRVHLEKHIPTGAGLGGGSSDAATMLLICNELSNGALSQDQLNALGLRLGADVPFFLSQQTTAIATGVGEVLAPLRLTIGQPLLIVKDPEVSIATKAAYESLQLKLPKTATRFAPLQGASLTVEQARTFFRNDFESGVFSSTGRLSSLKQELVQLGAGFSLMTGSGSAFYALFPSMATARVAETALLSRGYQVWLNAPTTE